MSSQASRAAVAGSDQAGRVQRHKLVDRIYHWVMAISVLTLMATAFLPIVGWKFEWLMIHWVTGLILTAAVLFHIIRALFFQKLMNMVPDGKNISSLGMETKTGKYNLAQKLYHLAVAVLILCAIASGLVMLRKIDTPFWKRDPYWFTDHGWGIIYFAHDFAAMALITLVMIHIYFALRPDEWHLTRSMFRGWMTAKEYQDHFDPKRWNTSDEA
ncbi:MAG TPA: cytochrome b/b6 domain-containing protein [Rhizomicrobium sp.]|nr:cytochrome b/b6 domain-containing protein [Rhizomicrobium sp.]